jgi:hypothetical protein
MQCDDEFAGIKVACTSCGQKIIVPHPPVPPRNAGNKTVLGKITESPEAAPKIPMAPYVDPRSAVLSPMQPQSEPFSGARAEAPHSGLGIASFIIGTLTFGLNGIVGFISIINMVSARDVDDAASSGLAGAWTMVCLLCTSIPVCLVGVGLGIAGMIAQKNSNQLFSRLGFIANGAVVAVVLMLFLVGSIMKKANQNQQNFPVRRF